MTRYVARTNAIYRAALDSGIAPKARIIAERAGISYQRVQRALAGYPTSANTMVALADLFQVPPDELFEPADPSRPARGSMRVAK